ncbi:hypothetical protein TNCV_2987041 [Trichonephila clavipes]|nr:hypothetical protein TNCV_2987041 [Trichonephila clavipes]
MPARVKIPLILPEHALLVKLNHLHPPLEFRIRQKLRKLSPGAFEWGTESPQARKILNSEETVCLLPVTLSEYPPVSQSSWELKCIGRISLSLFWE